MKSYILKNDRYRKARGGKSRFLDISCSKCGTPLMVYQKDGPGTFKRAYLDRIMTTVTSRLLRCQKCHHIIGVPYMYPKERRKAFLIELGSVIKKIHKTT